MKEVCGSEIGRIKFIRKATIVFEQPGEIKSHVDQNLKAIEPLQADSGNVQRKNQK